MERAARNESKKLKEESPNSSLERKKRPRTELSMELKMCILEAVDRGDKSKGKIAQQFGIPATTLSTILKHRDRLEMVVKESPPSQIVRKRMRGGKHDELEQVLVYHLKTLMESNQPITGRVIRDKAEELIKIMGVTDLKCSNGWLHRLKLRHQLLFSSPKPKSKTSPGTGTPKVTTKKQHKIENTDLVEDSNASSEWEEVQEPTKIELQEFDIKDLENGDVEILEHFDDNIYEDEENEDEEHESVEMLETNSTPNKYTNIEFVIEPYEPNNTEETFGTMKSKLITYGNRKKTKPSNATVKEKSPIKQIVQPHIISHESESMQTTDIPAKKDVFQALTVIEDVLNKMKPTDDVLNSFNKIKEFMEQTYPQYVQLKINDFFSKLK